MTPAAEDLPVSHGFSWRGGILLPTAKLIMQDGACSQFQRHVLNWWPAVQEKYREVTERVKWEKWERCWISYWNISKILGLLSFPLTSDPDEGFDGFLDVNTNVFDLVPATTQELCWKSFTAVISNILGSLCRTYECGESVDGIQNASL